MWPRCLPHFALWQELNTWILLKSGSTSNIGLPGEDWPCAPVGAASSGPYVDTQQPRSLAASGCYPLLAGHAWVPPAGAQAGSSQSGSWACKGFLSYICNSLGWFDSRLLGAYNLPGGSEMHLIWGNTNVLYITFSFCYWFQLEKAQIWREHE